MSEARVTIEVDGIKFGIHLDGVDLDQPRDKIALKIGRVVVDTIWQKEDGN